jgi:RNA polymerase sigma factor (sigma-70 family)
MHDSRPPEFDERVMKYFPAILKWCNKASGDRHIAYDMAVDVVEYCLVHWQNFREDGGFYNWLHWQFRGYVSNQAQKHKRDMHNRGGALVAIDAYTPNEASAFLPHTQSHAAKVEASTTIAMLSKVKDFDMAYRHAEGESYVDIAKDYSLSHQRVQQRVEKFREVAKRKI